MANELTYDQGVDVTLIFALANPGAGATTAMTMAQGGTGFVVPTGYKFHPTCLNVNSNANDTPEGIKKYVEARNLTAPLLKDTGNRVADYFDTRVTPTFYVIDKEGVLRYRGSYDDNREEDSAKKQYVTPALDAVIASRLGSLRSGVASL